MNSLSWFLYIADVIDNLSNVLVDAAIFFALFCIGCVVVNAMCEGEISKDNPNMWKHWWRCLWAGLVLGTIACFFPTKNTMYAIAASQLGEKIVQNEQVRGVADDASKALQQWIRKQIDSDKPKDK